ncbi:D-alanyl-D-alanine carboxypeptidase family protein [Chelativorans alearense]|uniref:D-alanyl-D-alanine carboxypeptidase family protein n=1 Tax=Chelativorans alearense TaxID=2681495 RepID=UPI0013D34BAF|nr:D-alanyl-D-alanine carboxypeptidase family protein [Chelativorans alearense]
MFRSVATAAALLLAILVLAGTVKAETFESKAPRAFMVDAETGAVLYSRNADEPFPPASLAKLMTMETVFDALKNGRLALDETFFVSEYAWRTGGAPSRTATMFAAVKSSVPLEALIKGAIVQSANDACIIIAEGMAGSEENFAAAMTKRARAIGLQESTFVNATGLPAEGQKVTAREMTLLARHLWREYPEYYRYFSQPDFEWNGIFQRNRNPLLPLEIGADGLGTGFTEASGYAITASAARQRRRVFVTLGGLTSEDERVEEARKIIDWGMRAFAKRPLFAAGEAIGEVRVYGGEKSRLAVRAAESLPVLVPLGEPERLSARIVYQGPVPAPVEEGAEVGTLQIWLDDTLSQEAPLYAAESVAEGTLTQRAVGAVGELLLGWTR